MEFIFGIVWTILTAFATIASYTAETVIVNDVEVTQAEFATMLFPKLFLGIFWAIGLFMIWLGLKKIIINRKINTDGEKAFGKICDIYNSGTYVNGRAELKADISLYILSTGETKVLPAILGYNPFTYPIGSYVELKYYDNKINVARSVEISEMPYHVQDILEPVETVLSLREKDSTMIKND